MNKKGYSQGSASGFARILDGIARDQVPQDLDLAPNIMARIQKRKGIHMQPRTKLISAALLVVIVFVVLFYTVPGIAAAIGHWFGYVPGVGLVREGQIRVLAHPVSVSRENVTVTVDQVVINGERTALIYSVDGIPNAAVATQPETACPYKVTLRLPDGSPFLATPNGIQSWASGYQHRFNYPPVPASVNDAKLVISCLYQTRPGTVPTDWEIPLHFVPAPPNMTAFPVIEIPTPTALAADATKAAATEAVATKAVGAEAAATLAVPAAAAPAQPSSITLTLDRAVQMDDGYLIYATVHWKDTPFTSLDVTNPNETLHLLDAKGQAMLYEFRYDEQTGVNIDQRQTTFAIKTAPVQTPGPLTLVLDWVSVELTVEKVSFVFDPGPDPKAGQTWTLNQDIKIGKYSLRVLSATTDGSGYNFEMSSNETSADQVLLNATLVDWVHPIVAGGGGGSGGNPGERFSYGFYYASGLPDGPVTVSVSSIGVRHVQRIEAQWTPPAASTNLLPTQPAACLTAALWKNALAQKPALPAGITGKVLTSGMLGSSTSGNWGMTISDPDGSNPQVIEGAEDGSLSPDGARLAYSNHATGISILDRTTGQTTPLPGTGNGDINPIWSPDGKQIVFNRGMGIFDLFIVNPDGSNMRQLTHGGVQEWPVGWLPDGHLLYTVPGREDEYTIYQVDVNNITDQGPASQEVSHDNLQNVSPGGKYIVTTEKTFGDRWLTYISEPDGSNRWLLANSDLWVMTPIWSPDGQWLLAGVSDTDPATPTAALINLRTCQVIPVPALKGNLLSWVP